MAKLYNKNGRQIFKGSIKLALAIAMMFRAYKVQVFLELDLFEIQEAKKAC